MAAAGREPVEVAVVLPAGQEVVAGTLWAHERRGHSASFAYAPGYLTTAGAYPLDPALPLVAGTQQTPVGKAMFNAFADGAPDRWGQNLMRRDERRRAEALGTTPRRLTDADFLLGARDDLRQGAIRLCRPDTSTYWSDGEQAVPRLMSLPDLLSAADRIAGDGATAADVRDLVQAGGSLGGARPKAAVRTESGRLAIAKFPRGGSDEWDVIGWERLELELAARSGVRTAPSQMITVDGRHVLVVERFDRDADGTRIGYASAMTMLEASDGDRRSYVDIAEIVETESPDPDGDLAQLYRRIVFNVLTGNTDDHLRNHGFLRCGSGWSLSPAFDLNPDPHDPRRLTTAIDDADDAADIGLVRSVAGFFRLGDADAVAVIEQVERATRDWRSVADALSLPRRETDLMAAAFDGPEREKAAAMRAATRASSPTARPSSNGGRWRVPAGSSSGGRFTTKHRGEGDGASP